MTPDHVELNERWSAMVAADLTDLKKQSILDFVNWIDRHHLPLNQFNDPAAGSDNRRSATDAVPHKSNGDAT